MSAGKALSRRYRAALDAGSEADRRSLQRVAVLIYGPAVEAAVIEVEPELRAEARQLARLGVLVALEEAARDGGDLDALVAHHVHAELDARFARKAA